MKVKEDKRKKLLELIKSKNTQPTKSITEIKKKYPKRWALI